MKPENLIFRRRIRSSAAAAASDPQQQQRQQQDQETGEWRECLGGEEDERCMPPLLTMDQQHELLLIDFDTSMFIEDPRADTSVNSISSPHRRLVGTYGYLAPEVLKSGCYSCASDLWSVGVILYILMTVRR